MRQALRFTFALVAGLALLTWGASVVVSRTTRAWFERDMLLRAELAVSGARETLVSHWAAGQRAELRKALVELTHDERVLGAAACGADLAPLARTVDYPAPLSCERLGPEVRPDADSPASAWTTWASVFSVPGGQVHATAVPIVVDDRPLGFVVLVHDLSFVERREATTRQFLLLGLRRPGRSPPRSSRWSPRACPGGAGATSCGGSSGASGRAPEFQPFLRDVRDLVERLAAEREADGQGGAVDAAAAQEHAEPPPPRRARRDRREPRALHPRARARTAASRVVHPASGLVTALEPVMRACSGVWVAHGSGSADRETVGRARPGARSRPARSRTSCGGSGSPPRRRRATTTASPTRACGRSATSPTRGPIFRSEDWEHYQAVNQQVRRRRVRGGRTPTTRSSSCRTTTSRCCRG